MTNYPTGVAQNMAPPNCPLDLQPVPQNNWRIFAPEADATTGLGMIEGVIDKAVMIDAEAVGGWYSQFIYGPDSGDIRARIVYGTASDEQGAMGIMEYPSEIFDRDTIPKAPFDKYSPGQPHVLKVQRLTKWVGQLYWSAA